MCAPASKPSGPHVHDGRPNLTPEAERQLNEIDDWIASKATADIARRFVTAIFEHIDRTLVSPRGGRARDDIRPGMRTTTYKKSGR